MIDARSALQRLAQRRREDCALARLRESDDALLARALASPLPARRFREALVGPEVRVIAEIKRASPSRARIADIADPVALANAYRAGGASAVSVLTEPHEFLGADSDLSSVAASTPLPVLRKDFLTEPRQLWEARLLGASAALLIVALLDRDSLSAMLRETMTLGLDALVEVHDPGELDRALAAGATIVGVNHRRLSDFTMDMTLFERLRPHIPASVVAVAESGIRTRGDVMRMRDAGAAAVLVGEQLASSAEPAKALRELLGVEP